jgi:hypothetical protein
VAAAVTGGESNEEASALLTRFDMGSGPPVSVSFQAQLVVKRPNWKARFMLLASLHLAALFTSHSQPIATAPSRCAQVTRGERPSLLRDGGAAKPSLGRRHRWRLSVK